MQFGKKWCSALLARKRRRKLARAVWACVAAIASTRAGADNTNSTWNGSIGNWSDPTGWDSGIVPQTGSNNATITSGQVTLDSAFNIGTLSLTGGSINGTNDVTINGLFNWSGGAMVDAGSAHAVGPVLLAGDLDKILATRTLVNDATATWSAGNLVTSNSAAIVNNGTFIASFDGNLQSQSGTNLFNNIGLFQKTAGAGGSNATAIGAVFNNSGAVQVQAGRLALAGGGSASGAFAVSAGAELAFQSDYTLAAASSLSGAGNVTVELGNTIVAGAYSLDGTTRISGGSIAFDSASATTKDLTLAGGVFTGAGMLSASGAVSWTGSILQGTGTLVASGTLDISGLDHGLSARTLSNAGSATWSEGNIIFSSGATFNNSGTLENNFAGTMQTSGINSGVFNNTGLFVKSDTGTTSINPIFLNGGTTRVSQGTLALAGGGSATGRFEILAGARLRTLLDYSYGPASTLTGAGIVEFAGGNNTVAGIYDLTGHTEITGGSTTFSASTLNLGTILALDGGSALIVTPVVTAAKLDQFGGNLDGPGSITFNDVMTWDSGIQKGTGTTTAAAGLLIQGTGNKLIDQRTIINAAGSSATWSAGDLSGINAGTLRNNGSFETTFDGNFNLGAGNQTASMVNTGLFLKSGGTGRTTLAVAYINSGTTRVSSGILTLSGGGSSTGNFDLPGGKLELTNGYVLAAPTTITGTNSAFIIGNVTLAGAVPVKNLTQTAGVLTGAGLLLATNFSWQGGTQDGGGGMTHVSSSFDLSTDGQKTLDARAILLLSSATTTWSGGTIVTANGAKFTNLGLFLNSFDGSMTYQTGALPSFQNQGEFRKSAGTGVSNIGIEFNNTGTARAASGTLRLAGGGSASGNFDVSDGAVMEFGFDYTLIAGASFTGPGLTRLSGGVMTFSSAASATNFEQTAGTLTGPANFTAGNYAWKGGTMTGGGTTTASTSLAINGTDLNLSGRNLAVAAGASAAWSAGDIRIAQGGNINNAGTFDINGDVNLLRVDGIDAVFNNTGTLRKIGGTNFASFAVLLNNIGTLEVSSGTLIAGVSQFDSASTALTGGTWIVSNGAKLDLGGGPGISTNFANVTLDGPTANFIKINDLADNRGTFTIKNGKQFLTGGTFDNSGILNSDANSGMLFGNVFTNSGTYLNAGTTLANFAFNSGIFTQTGPLTINVQMINSGTGTADIGGTQTWGAAAHLIVNGGSVILRTDAGAAAPNLVIDAKGGTTQFKVSQHLNGLNIDGGVVTLDAGGNKVIRTASYAPGGGIDQWNGKLDLADNRLIVDYALGSPIDVIANQLKTGYSASGAHWTGNGLISSTDAADPTLGLGYAEAAQVPLQAANFGGETISGNAVLVRSTKFGDTNLDGKVSFGDFQRLEAGFGKSGYWYNGDFNYDGVVDRLDLAILIQNYGQTFGQPAASAPPAELAAIQAFAGTVPEPAGLPAIALAGALLARRRVRRTY